ncbi:MAG: hypothetical protein EAX95_05150 [Candidatus Thorarchaeota archaeon]|nr:hypothetical protein [Candidatus Thorarchaeota archaeon]
MTKADEHYPVNTIPSLAWALELYLKSGARYKEKGIIEVIFPVGPHKERMMKKGEHEIILWISKKKMYLRGKCDFDSNCPVNSGRIDAANREAVKTLPWEDLNNRAFFKTMRKWIMRLDLDFVTLVRALNTIADSKVKLPLKTRFGKVFNKFNEYRTTRWPEDLTPDKREEYLEEVLLRVSFWIRAAVEVGAFIE